MKIAVVHQYYLSAGQPGGSRFNEFARLWSEAGHQVTVIAGNLNYATGEAPENCRGRWITEEQDGPVKVLRCYVPTTYNRGFIGRMWAFFGFTLSAMTAALKIKDLDVVIATSPPLVAVIPGWIAARWRFRPVPWIFEMRDLWPESAITTGVIKKDSLLSKILYAMERWAARKASLINVLTPAFRDDLIERGLAPIEKIAFVPNGADVDLFKPGPRDNAVRKEYGWGDRFVAMYAGAHGRANAVHQLIDAAEILKERSDILIASVGDGPEREKLQEEARRRGLDNIMFCGPQPKERMPDFVNACDLGMAVLQNNPTFRTVYPNKVFDYMACERPTLLAIDGVARKLVCSDAQAGIFAEPENPQQIAEAILKAAESSELRAEMGRRGREWVTANATRESLAERYSIIMERIAGASREPRETTGKQRGFQLTAKKIFDRSAASIGLILLAPIIAILAILIKITMGGPVFFRQRRPGFKAKPFEVIKFRTMIDARDEDGKPLPDEKRLTALGKFLRATSLDELPQLWNVFKGDLSLVGPRPLLMSYLDRYTPQQSRRHDALPGITGLAQVNGRNDLAWERKFELDLQYVENWNLKLDAEILLQTFWKVLKRDGVSRTGHATMPEFMGSDQ